MLTYCFKLFQMILQITRRTFASLLKVSRRTTPATAVSSNQQFNRKMSNQAIEEKFQFPKRYQGSTPSVW